MMLSRSREFKVNMGNYEHLTLSGMVVVYDVDLYSEEQLAKMTPDQIMAGLRAFVEKQLDHQLDPELDAAEELSEASSSMLYAKDTRPARTEKVKRS